MDNESSKPTDPGIEVSPTPEAPKAVEPEAAPVVAVPVAAKALPRYRVKTKKTFSLMGQLVTWHAGDIVEVSSYGHQGIERAIDAGVELEKI